MHGATIKVKNIYVVEGIFVGMCYWEIFTGCGEQIGLSLYARGTKDLSSLSFSILIVF
jgi:hypothetical protein